MFIMVVGLFTSRVNLSVLGIENNGIYQVVGGLVTMFSFLNGSLAGATSRFLTYEMGKGNKERIKQTFSASLEIHFIVAFIVLILAETIGLWFLNHKMVIPAERLFAAQVIYQLSIVGTILGIIQVPYMSTIIANEKMGAFAYLSILDVSLKLGICYLLYVIPYDKLISYGILTALVGLTNWLIHVIYCRTHFDESKFGFTNDTSILKPIMSFSGWDLFGNFSVMARSYGVNVIMNLFFGPVINSAVGFANTIGGAVQAFNGNFLTAVRPPIVKSYAKNDIGKMQQLMTNTAKFSFCLLLVLSVPFIFEGQYIVTLWLKTPPPYTAIFCRYDLILQVISSLFLPLVFVIHATGKIRFMSIVNGGIWFLTVPITYGLLYLGCSPIVPYITKIILLFFVVSSNLYNTKRLVPDFKVLNYLKVAVLPSVGILIITMAVIFPVFLFQETGFVRFISTSCLSTLTIGLCVWTILLSNEQRKVFVNKLHGIKAIISK